MLRINFDKMTKKQRENKTLIKEISKKDTIYEQKNFNVLYPMINKYKLTYSVLGKGNYNNRVFKIEYIISTGMFNYDKLDRLLYAKLLELQKLGYKRSSFKELKFAEQYYIEKVK